MSKRLIPSDLSITSYMHCRLCLEELPEGVSPMDFSRTQAGFTSLGIQVWCNRHNCNVVHIDFEGVRHPANTSRPATSGL